MKNLNINPLQINVHGQLIGKIWMPATYCTQHFAIDLTRERKRFTDGSLSISEAIERQVTMAGDFQSCSIAYASMTISFYSNGRTISRTFDISESKSIADLLMDDKEREEFENIDCYND